MLIITYILSCLKVFIHVCVAGFLVLTKTIKKLK